MMRHTVVAIGVVFDSTGCLPDRSDLDSGSRPFEQFTLFPSAMASTGRASDASENSKAEGLAHDVLVAVFMLRCWSLIWRVWTAELRGL